MSGELKEPGKTFLVYDSDDGKKIIDHYLTNPDNGDLITAVFGLAPEDLLRSIRAYRPKTSIEEYVAIMQSDKYLDHREPSAFH